MAKKKKVGLSALQKYRISRRTQYDAEVYQSGQKPDGNETMWKTMFGKKKLPKAKATARQKKKVRHY